MIVITEEHVTAGLIAAQDIPYIPGSIDPLDHFRAQVRATLEAVVPLITDAGEPIAGPPPGVVVTDRAIDEAGIVRWGFSPQTPSARVETLAMIQAAVPHLTITPAPEPENRPPGPDSGPDPQAYTETLKAHQQTLERFLVLAEEQSEVCQMQREQIAGETWRTAVALAGNQIHGSPTADEAAAAAILQDAQWFAHHLGNPPVTF